MDWYGTEVRFQPSTLAPSFDVFFAEILDLMFSSFVQLLVRAGTRVAIRFAKFTQWLLLNVSFFCSVAAYPQWRVHSERFVLLWSPIWTPSAGPRVVCSPL